MNTETCRNNNDSDGHTRNIERGKRQWIADWVASDVPVTLDVSTGYDGHRIFAWGNYQAGNGLTGGGIYIYGDNSEGMNDSWRNHESAMKYRYPGGRTLRGIVFNAWNGFGEGLAATPFSWNTGYGTTSGPHTTAYDWLASEFSRDPRECWYQPFENGQLVAGGAMFGAMCDLWQCAGAEEGFGEPESLESDTPGLLGRKRNFHSTLYPSVLMGTIYVSNATSAAHGLYGIINETYLAEGEDGSSLGFPVSDELDGASVGASRVVFFEHGYISWSSPQVSGHVVIDGPHGEMGNLCDP